MNRFVICDPGSDSATEPGQKQQCEFWLASSPACIAMTTALLQLKQKNMEMRFIFTRFDTLLLFFVFMFMYSTVLRIRKVM
jgi:hypothetical protein